MILDRCPRCKRAVRAYCEQLGRPCLTRAERDAKMYRCIPRDRSIAQREANRRYWQQKAMRIA